MDWYFVLLIIIGSILLLVIILIFIITLFVTNLITHHHRYSRSEQTLYNEKQGYNIGINKLKRINIDFKMDDGYIIHGDYNLVNNSKKFCILLHGHATSREGALRYSLIFNELGYSTILYDERSHGDNIHKSVTMGYKEAKDLIQIINEVYYKFGKDIYLGVQGVSMGAATALLALQYKPNLKFVVSDCAYSDLKKVIFNVLKRKHVPTKIILLLVNFNLKTFYHFQYKDCSPALIISDNKVPILYIHGNSDSFVPVSSVDDLFNKTTSYKKKVVFDGAEHASSLTVNRELYKKSIQEFLKEIEDK